MVLHASIHQPCSAVRTCRFDFASAGRQASRGLRSVRSSRLNHFECRAYRRYACIGCVLKLYIVPCHPRLIVPAVACSQKKYWMSENRGQIRSRSVKSLRV